MLDELKGKNIAYYSVMLGAFIQTKMERDKTLVTVSLGGLGYLITTVTYAGISSLWDVGFFFGGFAGFLFTMISALVIYTRNADLIEYELRGGASTQHRARPNLKQLDLVILIFFSVALLCAIIIGSKLGWSKFMTKEQKSVLSAERPSTHQDAQLNSLQGVHNLKPINPTPVGQASTAGTANTTTPNQSKSPATPKE